VKKFLVLAFTLLAALPAAAQPRYTEKCSATSSLGEVILSGSNLDRVYTIANSPQADPNLYYALWKPTGAIRLQYSVFPDDLLLIYDPAQDEQEIAASITAFGFGTASPNSKVCFGGGPPPVPVTVTEYYNRTLNHYFLSSSDAESAFLDAGGAGGWTRTNQRWFTYKADACNGLPPARRFYNTVANTHFYTAEPSECGFIRRIDPGWFYEGEAFAAKPPVGQSCDSGYSPIFRLYNNRAQFGDSNHRYTLNQQIIADMVREGWILEGLAMCIPRQ